MNRPSIAGAQSARQDLTLTVSNTTNIDTNSSEQLLVDGETTELRWSGVWSLGHGWQLQASVPIVHYEGGHLDSLIDDWHRLLGLPRGDRPGRPDNTFEFAYQRGDGTGVYTTSSHTGVADSALEFGYTALATERSTLNLWLGVELPTGERSDLTGNGSVDAAIWLNGARRLAEHWQLDATLGIVRPGSVEPLPLETRELVPFGSMALSWAGGPGYGLALQVDAHGTCVDNSDLELLGPAVLLTVGGHYSTRGGWRFELAVTEDLRSGASPDVALYFAVRRSR